MEQPTATERPAQPGGEDETHDLQRCPEYRLQPGALS